MLDLQAAVEASTRREVIDPRCRGQPEKYRAAFMLCCGCGLRTDEVVHFFLMKT